MKMIDIIIPSCKPYTDLRQRVCLIKETDLIEYNYIPTGFKVSASVNRNFGLLESFKSKNEYIIMIDDDIGGFKPGWQKTLIQPLIDQPKVRLVSARLFNPDGSLGPMMGASNDISKPFNEVPKFMGFGGKRFGAILSAAIAFRKFDLLSSGVRFNNNFIGSGWEDTLFCYHIQKAFSDCIMLCNNQCKLIHYHEMKNQNVNNQYNENLFKSIIACEEVPNE
jgi:glycosyltransferase involved in cell wall biosynthesis